MRLELERPFHVPLRDGFDYITDPRNWPEYWPGLIRVEAGSRWGEPGDRTRLVMRMLARSVELDMALSRLEPFRLVEYTSAQRGLPDARHERHFAEAGGGFQYRLVVELEPRPEVRGIFDRILVGPATARAMRRTLRNLDRRFASFTSAAADIGSKTNGGP